MFCTKRNLIRSLHFQNTLSVSADILLVSFSKRKFRVNFQDKLFNHRNFNKFRIKN